MVISSVQHCCRAYRAQMRLKVAFKRGCFYPSWAVKHMTNPKLTNAVSPKRTTWIDCGPSRLSAHVILPYRDDGLASCSQRYLLILYWHFGVISIHSKFILIVKKTNMRYLCARID
ncbi:hypothetical protein BT63DRAFT_37892 [Microthyrium microscopicum]|uniref:Uncharacterized protein n=1 Tax=Microthyrium microscopicum TaxID=703497 RepID=A0A6A6UUK0_9PEZI|nr:hypothetical protein BT63DRAFT_37892 [Microthyrium microscopicum]